MKKTLIYGGGTIGSFLAMCLKKKDRKIFFLCRGSNYNKIKKDGLRVDLYHNTKFKKKFLIKQNRNFKVINNIKMVNTLKFDEVFITITINQNLDKIFSKLQKIIKKNAVVITPCTNIPFWWYLCLPLKYWNKFEKKIKSSCLRLIKNKNIAGMTMWLSGTKKEPGYFVIKHVQRGFPIKEVFCDKKNQITCIRDDIKKNTKSPYVKNIFSEIFIKSINSLAFNMVALKYRQNNYDLSKNVKAKKNLIKILSEGDKILNKYNIKITQTPLQRIDQTLSSRKHTMSMLSAYNEGRKIEIKPLWRSFYNLTKIINYKMRYTENFYYKLIKKI